MAVISDIYSSIEAPSEGLYKELGSRFIAFAHPVETEGEVKGILDALRARYHDARHCCFAYRLGKDGERFRTNDDGEPSSTAGRPILSQIDSAGLSDILVVVVRYFGGIKLGVPGLARAYKAAAADAIANARKVDKVAGRTYSVTFDYSQMPSVMKAVKGMGLTPLEKDFSQTCRMTLRVRLTLEDAFLEEMGDYSPVILG